MADWEKFAARLREERSRLLEQVGSPTGLNQGVSFRDSVSELSFADNHPADLGSENFERGKDISLREREATRLQQVEEALERIDRGSYGVCLRCGEDIGEDRLEALPEAPLCVRCQEYEESQVAESEQRPVEEDRLLPPYARNIVYGDPGSDAEDFWQEAARHNKRPRIFTDGLEDEDTGLVEEVDAVSNEEYREQLPD